MSETDVRRESERAPLEPMELMAAALRRWQEATEWEHDADHPPAHVEAALRVIEVMAAAATAHELHHMRHELGAARARRQEPAPGNNARSQAGRKRAEAQRIRDLLVAEPEDLAARARRLDLEADELERQASHGTGL